MALPAGPGSERDRYILDTVDAGRLEFSWAPITSLIPGHSGTFYVFADAGKVDGIRVGVGARILQQIADKLGASFMTPKLQDLSYAQAPTKILPWLDYSPTMMQSTQWFVRATDGINKMAAEAEYRGGLLRGMGKPWMISNALLAHPGRAENYGLYVPANKVVSGRYFGVYAPRSVTLPDVHVLQDPGWAHTLGQDDYSELVVLASRQCTVDGRAMDLADVMRDPTLAALVSHEGPLRVLRQPGVALEACLVGGLGNALGYGEDGSTVCPIKITGSPAGGRGSRASVAASSDNNFWGVVAAIGLAAAVVWWSISNGGRNRNPFLPRAVS